MHMKHPTSPLQWLNLYRLYRSAFPKAERRPFSSILSMSQSGQVDVWYFEEDDHFAGLATTINGDNSLVLLDYFAVSPGHRDQGWGSKMLKMLLTQYHGQHLFGEIEAQDPTADNAQDRIRRKKFYLRLGLQELGIHIRFFGVEMELLSNGYPLTYPEYENFYRKALGDAFVSHIEPLNP